MPKKIILSLKLTDSDIKKFDNISNVDYEKVYYPDAKNIHEIKAIGESETFHNNFHSVENTEKINNNGDIKVIKEFAHEFYMTTTLYSSEYMNIKDAHTIPYNYSNSVCWWCCHYLDENCIPTPIPVKYNEKLKIFKCVGIFCSFNCALAYCKKMSYGDSSLLYYLYKKVCSDNKYRVFPPFNAAPDREVLKMFGGILTIKEFRESCKNNINTFNILEYPIVYNQRCIVHSKSTAYNDTIDTNSLVVNNQEETRQKQQKFPDFFEIDKTKKIKSKKKVKSISEMLK